MNQGLEIIQYELDVFHDDFWSGSQVEASQINRHISDFNKTDDQLLISFEVPPESGLDRLGVARLKREADRFSVIQYSGETSPTSLELPLLGVYVIFDYRRPVIAYELNDRNNIVLPASKTPKPKLSEIKKTDLEARKSDPYRYY